MNNIKISIIVPIFNVEKYLSECLDSLVHQDLPQNEYEIILVNDGSTDRSGEIAKEYAEKYENISYYEQENQGQAVARNLGMDKAQGEYIMFVDSDDYLRQNVLMSMYQEAKNNDNDVLITGFLVYNSNNNFTETIDLKVFYTNFSGPDALLNGLNIGSTCSRLYKTNFIKTNALKFRSGIKHEDVYFNVEAYPIAKSIRAIDLYTYNYRWNEGSTDRSFDSGNVMMGLMSDLEISKLEMDKSNKYLSTNYPLSFYFQKKANSLLVSNLLSFYTTNKGLSSDLRKQYYHQAKEFGLFPIKGGTNSWKTKLLSIVFNIIFNS